MNRNTGRSVLSYWFFMLVLILILYVIHIYNNSDTLFSDETTRQAFEESVEAGDVTSVRIVQEKEIPSGYVVYTDGSENSQIFYVSDVNEVQEYLNEMDMEYSLSAVQTEGYFMTTIFPVLLIIIALVILFMIMNSAVIMGIGGGQSNNKMANFGRSRARRMTEKDKKITFDDVAGLAEEKEQLWEIVDFLKDPEKYNSLGARIPKGVLLEGPPGTGKTLLAKAVAGEAGVAFFSISGSDFVEMFVGVGASRVRDMFEDAKANAPCIVFIDEIDAVARRRGTGMGGGHDEREQTLNQLLVEMDGFGENEGIIVMAATNRVDILDPAILRPGRFDRKVLVGRPDVTGRRAILDVHSKNKPLGDDVDLDRIAKTTAGYTGADLENLLNESAIAAAKADRKYIKESDVEDAFVRVSIGTEKHSRIISDEEKRITAYHESGHAILFHVLPLMDRVHTISIIPTGGGAAGYTMPLPENDNMFMTKSKILQHIMVCLGGRIAEELIFDDVTTGASQDIKDATNAAREMVTQYGMSSELGMINYSDDEDEVFIGRDLAHTRSYSERTAAVIDDEVRRIVNDCYEKAKAIIKEHEDVLHRSAALLIEKEKITTEEFEGLFEGV